MAEADLMSSPVGEKPIYWDPYEPEVFANPYPVLKRLREEAPLYYNERYDFYAVTRYDDCIAVLGNRDDYVSKHGGVIEVMKSGIEVPSGMFIYEDPPLHTTHRRFFTKVFTPKHVAALDSQVRDFCVKALDPLVGGKEIDFIEHLGAEMPMRVIGMLLGMPEDQLKEAQRNVDESMRTEPGQQNTNSGASLAGEYYSDFVDYRIKNPGDDLISTLLNTPFEDEHGVTRTLTRAEVLAMVALIFGAGNETTNRLIGWTAKLLSDRPDDRREVHANPAMIPEVLEEVLRYEPPGMYIGRTVVRDVELHGTTVPAGSAILAIVSAANRDEAKFPNGEVFDIHRGRQPHLTFGYGFHNCLGNALARVEGRIAFEEVFKRFRDWEVDMSRARMSSTATVRGWETLPARL
jgi:cytochrome P450